MRLSRFEVGFLGTNCYVLDDGKNAVVIDPGADAAKILKFIKDENLSLEHIFLTHAHFDHVLAVSELIKETGAKLYAHEGEKLRLCDASVSGHTMLKTREFIPLYADVLFSDGDEVKVGEMSFKFMNTPGHTEGSTCIITEDMIFSGDTLFLENCGRCDLAGGDFGEMLRSLRALALLPGDYQVYPGHGEATTLSHERKNNPYMIEAMSK